LVSALPSAQVAPRRRLGVAHAVSVCVGMVIGAGIFKSTPLAAAVDLAADAGVLALWVFGGAMSLAGALCFAELAAAFPIPAATTSSCAKPTAPRRGSCSRGRDSP
jgi:amino acid transporter